MVRERLLSSSRLVEFRGRVHSELRAARTRWRRSLKLRVATTTLLVSGVVVLLVGAVLLNQITAVLLESKQKSAVQELQAGVVRTRAQLESVQDAGVDEVRDTISDTAGLLANRGGDQFDLVFISRDPQFALSPGADDDPVVSSSVPDDLEKLVVDEGRTAYRYWPVLHSSGEENKSLVVGAPVDSPIGTLGLYYFFPLESEEESIALIERTVYVAGLAIVLLVAAISVLVTRQVVRPVRQAAQTATRVAEGHLEERMQVRGEDDLALLASRFNEMADSLQRQITKLEELSRLQRRFTSDVSHELRTPLTTVRMAAHVLHAASDDFPPEVARSAELLQLELDRFETLLADLLEISRYDAGAAVLEPESTDLRALVEEVAQATSPVASRSGSDLVLHLPDEPIVAEVDRRRVERVLRNLIGNAAEHGEGRPVEVTLASDENAVAVAVRDHGVGLQPGEGALVFNRFWRADLSRNRGTGGIGLGLSISLEDARLHGGWLHAWGRPGEGSQFRLTLPRRRGHTLARSPLPLQPPRSDSVPTLTRELEAQ